MQNSLFQTLYFEDLAVGMRATIRKTVENEDVLGFAELSGDHNPIHLSEHFARKTRFGGRIVHGLYTASLISGVIGMRLPGPGAVYISQTLNFLGAVKIGDSGDKAESKPVAERCAARLGSEEAARQARQVLRGNAGAVVFNDKRVLRARQRIAESIYL